MESKSKASSPGSQQHQQQPHSSAETITPLSTLPSTPQARLSGHQQSTATPATPLQGSATATTGYGIHDRATNSIEIYDDANFKHSILTRSARIRKFKFYQYKPIQQETPTKQDNNNSPQSIFNFPKSRFDLDSDSLSPSHPGYATLVPRDDIFQGKIPLVSEESKELQEVEEKLSELEEQISNIKSNQNSVNKDLDQLVELVNLKNDLLRRQMQLNITEQEKALEKANEELTKELRSLMVIDDSRKTRAQLDRQKHLCDQSLALVNKRNALVQHMDVQERGIDDDIALRATLKTVISDGPLSSKRDQNCCIQ